MTPPDNAQRWALIVRLGRDFNGFARQASTPNTVQQRLRRPSAEWPVNPFKPFAPVARMRVHATAQVVHFDTTQARPSKAWVLGANTICPPAFAFTTPRRCLALSCALSAQARTYRYLLASALVPSATLNDQVSWTRFALDITAMQQACHYFLGEQDFTSFRTVQCQPKAPCAALSTYSCTQ